MSVRTTPKATKDGPPQRSRTTKYIWLVVAFVATAIVALLPTPDGLTIGGQRALAILVFAIIVWLTEAVSYPVSAFAILSFLTVFMAYSPDPDPESGGENLGTSAALSQALGGFSTGAWALVLAALFLAAAMQATNLHRRIALLILKTMGEKTDMILLGTILISTVLAFIVPSSTARVGAILPILLGLVVSFGLGKKSNMAAMLVLTAVHASTIWNIGLKTGAAQNILMDGLVTEGMGQSITWGRWFIAGAPWAAIMCVALFFVMRKVFKPESDHLEGGKELATQQLRDLGPVRPEEWKLITVTIALLFFWSTEGILHDVDSSTATVVAIAVLLMPGIGVFTWKKANEYLDWGTVWVLGVSISLGTVLMRSGAAQWLSDAVLAPLGLADKPIIVAVAICGLFGILLHLGFASGSSMTSVFIPVTMALALTFPTSIESQIGFVLVMQFIVNFGFWLPISTPQGLLAHGTGTFTGRDFLKSGIPITVIGYALLVVFAGTYWQWIGIL
ncbi:MAG: SLC13 family permease [Ancrocorticia sp.]|uniref:SLC13 family permease n=1 Tax=Ancrocorticia sp. TaxID=2593684 RepID=UPI003F91639A